MADASTAAAAEPSSQETSPAAPAAPPPPSSTYDLTPKLGAFLDRHLVFPLLEFLQEQGVYPEAELLQAKIELLQHTNMVARGLAARLRWVCVL